MAFLGNTINPSLNPNNRSVNAQGANVGDYARDSSGQTYRWDGVSWSRDQGPGGGGGGFSGNISNPVDTAKQLLDFQIQANQPAIQTLQGQTGDLQKRYSDLLDSIKGQGSVAVNAQTLATSQELGRRGVMPDSGLGANQIAQSIAPVTSQYANLTAQTGLGEQQDLLSIANQIAALQRGDPNAAITGAGNILGIQQGASNLSSQLAEQLAAAKIGAAYQPISSGGGLYDVYGNRVITRPTAPLPSSGYNSGGIQDTRQPLSTQFGY